MRQIATIGIYGYDGPTFLRRLQDADVTLLLDVRQRRGVRGPQYAWANSRRLQAALEGAGIAYRHHLELAPTTELRRLQYAVDDRQGVGKRSRQRLAAEYVHRYEAEILECVDLASFVSALPRAGIAAMLCVEYSAHACHRSLIGRRLADLFGMTVVHL
jgi:uncharacterized protein (DUF488 family)